MRAGASRLAMIVVAALTGGCAARPHMCGGPEECGGSSACVAGRCQRANVIAAVQATSRMVLAPVAVAYVRKNEPPGLLPAEEGALPETFTLGRDADGDARLYLKFAVPLPPKMEVVEAYLLLEQSDTDDADREPLTLRVGRVTSEWDARSISYARAPGIALDRIADTRLSARPFVRVDVRDVVKRWRRHDANDRGLVVLVDGTSKTGVTFALAPALSPRASTSPEPTRPLVAAEPLRPVGTEDLVRPRGARGGPTLELYVQWSESP